MMSILFLVLIRVGKIVLNTNDDLPDPDTPVIVINLFFGKVISIFLRLWVDTHSKISSSLLFPLFIISLSNIKIIS